MYTVNDTNTQNPNKLSPNQDILAPDQAYDTGLYGQGPNGTGNGRSYQQGNLREFKALIAYRSELTHFLAQRDR